jgi:hypothetical protein
MVPELGNLAPTGHSALPALAANAALMFAVALMEMI